MPCEQSLTYYRIADEGQVCQLSFERNRKTAHRQSLPPVHCDWPLGGACYVSRACHTDWRLSIVNGWKSLALVAKALRHAKTAPDA